VALAPAVEARDVSFGYRAKDEIFSRLCWRVEGGEWWAIVGPSGCGKTTLLYLLAGLRRPRLGQVLIQGQPLAKPRPSTGLILQDFGLLPWARATDNIRLGLRIRGVAEAEQRQIAAYWLRHLDIDDLGHHYPSQLSGGQRQRVAIARTLALDPDLLLMDEPFGSLDTFTREGLQSLVAGLGQERARTCILVTHDIEEAVFLGSRILVLGYPPVTDTIVVENPSARQCDYREDPEFYRKCSEVKSRAVAAQRQGNAGGRATEEHRLLPVFSTRGEE